ncbi:MAG TPA: Fic family protein [Chloroflexia bacterium]|jgi:Fic family protein
MNLERFRQSGAGRLVKAGQGNAAYWAFVPNPLPPDVPLQDMALLRALSDADRAIGELAGLGRNVPNPQLLVRPFIRREAVLSSRIEGTQTGIAELYAYEAGQPPLPGLEARAPEEDAREVLNYVEALEYGLERRNTLPISLRFIKELHYRLLRGVRGERSYPGEFRATQNWIGGATLNSAVFVPPPPAEMHELLDNLEKYIHLPDDYPPLVRLAIIHQQFESIHPFVDGNGRTGRLLISLLLVHWNLLPVPLLYLSEFFERNRQTYYDLLRAVSEEGAWREWILFFLQGVAEQARDAVERAKRLQDLQVEWHRRLREARVSAALLMLVDSLFHSPFLTIPDTQRLINVQTYHTARAAVQKLVDLGIVEQRGNERYGKVYVGRELLELIQHSG